VSHETLAAIAAAVSTSVRALEGALIRVVAYASLRGEEPTPELAKRVLSTLYDSTTAARPSSLDEIQAAAAAALDVAPASLLAHDRRPRVALARHVAMYLARELTDQSLPAIGRYFGGRNHSTVLHAHRRITSELGTRAETTGAVERARSTLREQPPDRLD
jgi:chromosomal replication initiator protein